MGRVVVVRETVTGMEYIVEGERGRETATARGLVGMAGAVVREGGKAGYLWEGGFVREEVTAMSLKSNPY